MRRLIINKGDQFGRLKIITEITKRHVGRRNFLCVCECGGRIEVELYLLKNGGVKSCGCLVGRDKFKHGLSQHPLYQVWADMKDRCKNKFIGEPYIYYGARGIRVCDDWQIDFINFYNWAINSGYSRELQLERIDNNGNYEPSNCKWADRLEQGNNKRNNRLFFYKRKLMTIPQICRMLGIEDKERTIRTRLTKLHWDIEDAIKFNYYEKTNNQETTQETERTTSIK